MKMQQNFVLAKDPLSLDRIRSVLIRLEDTIIFSLIERAQFAHNPRIYQRGAFQELKDVGFSGSWLEWFLEETETFHGARHNILECSATNIGDSDILHQQKHDGTPGK